MPNITSPEYQIDVYVCMYVCICVWMYVYIHKYLFLLLSDPSYIKHTENRFIHGTYSAPTHYLVYE